MTQGMEMGRREKKIGPVFLEGAGRQVVLVVFSTKCK